MLQRRWRVCVPAGVASRLRVAVTALVMLVPACVSSAYATQAMAAAWTPTTPLPSNQYYAAAVAAAGRVYVLGGQDSSGRLTTVRSALVQGDGFLGAWRQEQSLQVGRADVQAASDGSHIWVPGGMASDDPAAPKDSSVEVADIGPGGQLSAFRLLSSHLNQARSGSAVVVANGYLFVYGGDPIADDRTTTCERAQILPGGDLGPFQLCPSMNIARMEARGLFAGGYLWAVNGMGPAWDSQRSVEKARVNSDGTLGAWQVVPETTLSYHIGGGQASDGTSIYSVGGAAAFQPPTTTAELMSVDANGNSGSWGLMTSQPQHTVSGGNLVFCNQHLYSVDGATSYVEFTDDPSSGGSTTNTPASSEWSLALLAFLAAGVLAVAGRRATRA